MDNRRPLLLLVAFALAMLAPPVCAEDINVPVQRGTYKTRMLWPVSKNRFTETSDDRPFVLPTKSDGDCFLRATGDDTNAFDCGGRSSLRESRKFCYAGVDVFYNSGTLVLRPFKLRFKAQRPDGITMTFCDGKGVIMSKLRNHVLIRSKKKHPSSKLHPAMLFTLGENRAEAEDEEDDDKLSVLSVDVKRIPDSGDQETMEMLIPLQQGSVVEVSLAGGDSDENQVWIVDESSHDTQSYVAEVHGKGDTYNAKTVAKIYGTGASEDADITVTYEGGKYVMEKTAMEKKKMSQAELDGNVESGVQGAVLKKRDG